MILDSSHQMMTLDFDSLFYVSVQRVRCQELGLLRCPFPTTIYTNTRSMVYKKHLIRNTLYAF